MKFFGLSSISASDVAQWGIGLDAQRGIRVETHTGSLTGAALTTHGAHLHATPRQKFERQLERERVRVARSFYQTGPSCLRLRREDAAADLVELDGSAQGLEIALSEALNPLPMDVLEHERDTGRAWWRERGGREG